MKKYLLLAFAVFATGCTLDSHYTQPAIYKFQNQAIIADDFDRVWGRLVKRLSSDFFVKKNIDKNARIISVSFSTGKPSEYVDCGRAVRYFSSAKGDNAYIYNPSDSAVYTLRNNRDFVFDAVRKTRLRGLINIYLAPHNSETMLTVNTTYAVDVNVTYYDSDNNDVGSDNFTFNFSTEADSFQSGITCTARGSLEAIIMAYAKKG